MKLSKPKYIAWSRSCTKTGREKGYKVEINYNDYYEMYYFCLENGEYTFNSCWENMKYTTEEECVAEAEKYIDELVKMGGK